MISLRPRTLRGRVRGGGLGKRTERASLSPLQLKSPRRVLERERGNSIVPKIQLWTNSICANLRSLPPSRGPFGRHRQRPPHHDRPFTVRSASNLEPGRNPAGISLRRLPCKTILIRFVFPPVPCQAASAGVKGPFKEFEIGLGLRLKTFPAPYLSF